MHDDKTAHLALPLPHPGNRIEVDVLRLRAAFAAIDDRLAALTTVLQTDGDSLANVQAIIAAVGAAQDDINSLTALIETQVTKLTADFQSEFNKLRPLIYAGL